MKNSQEIWTAMILSGYAKKQGIVLSEAAQRLLNDGGLSYYGRLLRSFAHPVK